MEKRKFSLPKKYWIYLSLTVVFGIFCVLNILLSDWWISETNSHYFTVFLVVEIFIVLIMVFSAVKGRKMIKQNTEEKQQCYDYQGIDTSNYEDVWFNFGHTSRALIKRNGNSFLLHIEEFCEKEETWHQVNTVSCYTSKDELKKALFYEFHFYYNENTVLDEHDNVIYKGAHD